MRTTSMFILYCFLIGFVSFSCNKVSSPNVIKTQDLPTLGSSGIDFEEEDRDEIIESTSGFYRVQA